MNTFIERYTTLVILKRQYALVKTETLRRQLRVAQIKLGEIATVLRVLNLSHKGYTNAGITAELGIPEVTVQSIIKRWDK